MKQFYQKMQAEIGFEQRDKSLNRFQTHHHQRCYGDLFVFLESQCRGLSRTVFFISFKTVTAPKNQIYLLPERFLYFVKFEKKLSFKLFKESYYQLAD